MQLCCGKSGSWFRLGPGLGGYQGHVWRLQTLFLDLGAGSMGVFTVVTGRAVASELGTFWGVGGGPLALSFYLQMLESALPCCAHCREAVTAHLDWTLVSLAFLRHLLPRGYFCHIPKDASRPSDPATAGLQLSPGRG